MQNRITATCIGNNTWLLICQAHSWVGVMDVEGSPEAAMHDHIDGEHPGEVFYTQCYSGWKRHSGGGEPVLEEIFLSVMSCEWDIPAAVASGEAGDGKWG